jgi:hypothetical protein
MSMDELRNCPRRYTVLAEQVADGCVVEQSVTGQSRAEDLFERWDEDAQLCNLRVKCINQPMDDVTRHFEHDWPPTGNEPESSDGGTKGWQTR